jgi:hypothetical protein
MNNIIILILSILATGVLVADEADPTTLPAGAVPFQETVELPDKSLKLAAKNSGYKLQVNGATVLVGPWKSSLPTGEVVISGFYDPQGKKTGVWKTYTPDGKVMQLETFKNGVPNGLIISFRPDGIPAYAGWSLNGRQEGISASFSEDGKIVHVEQLKDGILLKNINADGYPPPPPDVGAFLSK